MEILSGPTFIDPTAIAPEGHHVVVRSNRLRTDSGTFKLPGTPVALVRAPQEGEVVEDDDRFTVICPLSMQPVAFVRVVEFNEK